MKQHYSNKGVHKHTIIHTPTHIHTLIQEHNLCYGNTSVCIAEIEAHLYCIHV